MDTQYGILQTDELLHGILTSRHPGVLKFSQNKGILMEALVHARVCITWEVQKLINEGGILQMDQIG